MLEAVTSTTNSQNSMNFLQEPKQELIHHQEPNLSSSSSTMDLPTVKQEDVADITDTVSLSFITDSGMDAADDDEFNDDDDDKEEVEESIFDKIIEEKLKALKNASAAKTSQGKSAENHHPMETRHGRPPEKKHQVEENMKHDVEEKPKTRRGKPPWKKRCAKEGTKEDVEEKPKRFMGVSLRGRNFPCSECPRKFTCKISLSKHMESAHSEPGKSKQTNGNSWKMWDEEEEDQGDRREKKETAKRKTQNKSPISCEECGKEVNTPSGLSLHKLSHLSEEDRNQLRRNECTLCGQKFKLFATLVIHQKKKHDTQPALTQPRRRKTPQRMKGKCNCVKCDSMLPSTKALIDHYKDDHGMEVGKKAYLCKFCDKSFKQPSLLFNHESIHLNRTPFHCGDCGRRYNSREAFRRHRNDCASRREGREFKCPHCPASYTSRSSMLSHVLNLHTRKLARCKKCSRVMARMEALKKHMKTCKGRHLGEKAVASGQRQDYLKPYWNQMELFQFRVSGSNQRKTVIRCVRCKLEGKSRSEIAHHIVTVHQPEVLKCPTCGKRSETLGKAHSHARACKKRQCPQCREVFCSMQYAKAHIASMKCMEKPTYSERWKVRKLVQQYKKKQKVEEEEEYGEEDGEFYGEEYGEEDGEFYGQEGEMEEDYFPVKKEEMEEEGVELVVIDGGEGCFSD